MTIKSHSRSILARVSVAALVLAIIYFIASEPLPPSHSEPTRGSQFDLTTSNGHPQPDRGPRELSPVTAESRDHPSPELVGFRSTLIEVRAQDMVPVPGARVTCSGLLTGHTEISVTDGDGRVELFRRLGEASLLSVSAKDFAYKEVTVPEDASETVTVTLDTGWTITGFVVDESGQAVTASVDVTLRSSKYMMVNQRSSGRSLDALSVTTSDAQGHFVSGRLESGEQYTILVEDSDYVTVSAVGPILESTLQPIAVPIAPVAAVALEIAAGSNQDTGPSCRSFRALGNFSYRALTDNCIPFGMTDTLSTPIAEGWIKAAPVGTTRKVVLFQMLNGDSPETSRVGFKSPMGSEETALSNARGCHLLRQSRRPSKSWGSMVSTPPGG